MDILKAFIGLDELVDSTDIDDGISENLGDLDKKQLRLEHPTGWLLLAKHDNVCIIIDALLGLPPRSEFNKTELAEHAGVSRQSATNYVNLLLALDVLEEVPDTSPTRYRMPDSAVVKELFELNSALNAAGMNHDPPDSYGND